MMMLLRGLVAVLSLNIGAKGLVPYVVEKG